MASESQKAIQRKPPITSKQAMSYIILCFRYIGVLYNNENKCRYFLLSGIIHLGVVVFLPISFISSYLVESNKDIDFETLLTSVQVAINAVGSSIKVCMLIYYVPLLLKTEPILAELDARIRHKEEYAFLFELQTIVRRFVVGVLILFWCYASFTATAGILAGHPPYSLYLPYINWRNSNWEFVVAAFIEWLLMMGACYQEVANDTYAPIYVSMLRAHVNILRLRLSKLGTNPDNSLEDNVEELKLCIKDHKKIIELYDIITPVISATIFLQFNLTAAVMGLTLINLTLFAKSFSARLANVVFVISVSVETFPLCYYANCLMHDSDRLCEDIFHSSWIDQSSKYRKLLVVFMQRTQMTIVFLAGKMILINVNSFITIAKLSLSVYTMVRKLNRGRLGLE